MKWIINKYYTDLMKASDHGYKGEINPYHMEGSVYTHTQMVIEEINKLTNKKILLAAAQLHDIGKPLARHEKKNRAYFSGHEGISAYLSLNYAKENNLDAKKLFKLVALHGILYRYPKTEMIEKSFTTEFWDDLKVLIQADHLGRITDQDKSELNELLSYEKKEEAQRAVHEQPVQAHFAQKQNAPVEAFREMPDSYEMPDDASKNLIILIGPPNSGKSTYIKNNIPDYKIISRDNLILELKKTNNYDKAFKRLTDEEHKEINRNLDLKFRSYLKENENIVIDMTNMSPKSRRKWTHSARGYNIKFVLFLTPFEKIMERNKNRLNKCIPERTIIKFMNKFSYPIPYKERYNELEVVLDEDLCYQV